MDDSSVLDATATSISDIERKTARVYPRRWINLSLSRDGGKFELSQTTTTVTVKSTAVEEAATDATVETSKAAAMQSAAMSAAAAENEIGGCRAEFMGDQDRADKTSFRIATYNILTDNCIRDGQYLHCPEQIRYMCNRHGHIMEEIAHMSPDILCVQEADEVHFRDRLKPDMDRLGYDCIYVATTAGQGLAIFWKQTEFSFVNKLSQLMNVTADELIKDSSTLSDDQKSLVRRVIERPEVTLAVRLRHLATERELAIANVHVAWTELRLPALQALQISMAVRILSSLSLGSTTVQRSKTAESQPVSAYPCAQIICGDFNTPPSFPGYKILSGSNVTSSDFFELLQQRENNNSKIFNDQIERLKAFELVDFCPEMYTLGDIQLSSAYKTVLGREPDVTNCDDASEDQGVVKPLCLDYIWFTSHSLDVTGVLETPTENALRLHHCLPSPLFPSDHIPLLAAFRFVC